VIAVRVPRMFRAAHPPLFRFRHARALDLPGRIRAASAPMCDDWSAIRRSFESSLQSSAPSGLS
jgi:hypothetical protein